MCSMLGLQASAQGGQAQRARILIYTKAAGYQHASIPVAEAAILKLAGQNRITADMSGDPADFNDANLKKYKAVIFVSTTGNNIPGEEQRAAFKRFIEAGGGYVGIHAATDANYDWQWYGDLSGAYFKAHPAQQMATLNVVDTSTIATRHLPSVWKRVDEWYHFKYLAKDLHVLINFDESSIKYKDDAEAANMKMGPNHPMAWWHDFDGGRAFYTELGHTDESYSDPLYLQHLLGGIQYAIGAKKMKE